MRRRDLHFIGIAIGGLLVLAGIYVVLSGWLGMREEIDLLGVDVTPDDLERQVTLATLRTVEGLVTLGVGGTLFILCLLAVIADRRREREGRLAEDRIETGGDLAHPGEDLP